LIVKKARLKICCAVLIVSYCYPISMAKHCNCNGYETSALTLTTSDNYARTSDSLGNMIPRARFQVGSKGHFFYWIIQHFVRINTGLKFVNPIVRFLQIPIYLRVLAELRGIDRFVCLTTALKQKYTDLEINRYGRSGRMFAAPTKARIPDPRVCHPVLYRPS